MRTHRCGAYMKLSLVASDDIEWKMRTPSSLLVIPGRGSTHLPRVTTVTTQYGDTRGELLGHRLYLGQLVGVSTTFRVSYPRPHRLWHLHH
jgi:hypothetical protein